MKKERDIRLYLDDNKFINNENHIIKVVTR